MTRFTKFSDKQKTVLNWWCYGSRLREKDGIICDGAIRSGKTLSMTISFISWAFYYFGGNSFALCGKTIASLRRNVVTPCVPILKSLGFSVEDKVSKNMLIIKKGNVVNYFYLFGGKDESSASLIQGMTLGGVLFDEVALMPRSFVEQALARCSLASSKYWFNCNPEHPYHWFYNEWIKKADVKNVIYLHFTMDDNPSLSEAVKSRYKNLYSGAFYERFVEGKWVASDGLVYPMFSPEKHVKERKGFDSYYMSCDYGTVNPFSLGLWGHCDEGWFRIREFYHSSREKGVQLTDEEYYEKLKELAGNLDIKAVIIDPSAASFIETVKRHGEFNVIRADNDVLKGINRVCEALKNGEIYISPNCRDTIREFSVYRWDNDIRRDAPKKENDHAMDDIRYFVQTVLSRDDDFIYSIAVTRNH